MSTPPIWKAPLPASPGVPRVAYFCMEYGLSERFPIYSGGLGVLAGDYMKSAGDLKLPVVGIGLRWNNASTQFVEGEGQVVDAYHEYSHDFLEDTGIRIRVRIKTREVECRVWHVSGFGAAPLLLIEPAHFEDRWITERLYDSRPDCRVAQEMLLGIGGVRALSRLRIPVDVYHFNEGHAVFAGLELIAHRMANNVSFEQAWAWARERIVFTTHTPVPAGNEVHRVEELRRLGACLELVDSEVQAIGGNPFGMTVAGLRLARIANAVAQLHARTAREMWKDVSSAAPIIGITNGVHRPTWQAPGVARAAADGEQLWAAHTALKQELLTRVEELTGVALAPEVLTIGFARRAATYKRANLILSDPGRLEPLLAGGRLQIIFSGKAHQADHAGKSIISTLVEFARKWPQAVVFLQNYDMSISRAMIRGCDVWLNNPQRPQEASGTSGMKAAMNGVLNASILDGWWPEGCRHGENGWAIGNHDEGPERDATDARSLYDLLEKEILPAWADRTHWVRMMQASIRMAEERFSSDRMVREYYERLYVTEPAAPEKPKRERSGARK